MATISINPQECTAAMKKIQEQTAAIQTAINVVKNSPGMMPSWKGNRSNQYQEFVANEATNLTKEAENLERILKHVETTLRAMLAADGVSV